MRKKSKYRDANSELRGKSKNIGMQTQNYEKKVKISGCKLRLMRKKSQNIGMQTQNYEKKSGNIGMQTQTYDKSQTIEMQTKNYEKKSGNIKTNSDLRGKKNIARHRDRLNISTLH